MQKKVKEFNEALTCHKKRMPESARLLSVVSECGELAKTLLKNSRYGTQDLVITDDFKMEFGDILYNLLSLANEIGIDADVCLNMALEKYKARQQIKNDLSSANAHFMKLKDEPFNAIKSGTKTIELRLYDKKRQAIQIGDIIEFTNLTTSEVLRVKVVNLHKFKSFEQLYKNFNKIQLGYKNNEVALPSDMTAFYPLEEQQKFGVVGIEIEVIK